METGVAAFALILAGYALIANRLDALSIGPALAFVVVGLVLGPAVLDVLPVGIETTTARQLAEVTLALVLFTDASTVHVTGLRRDASLIGRLLGIGLLLTIVAGGIVATVVFPEIPLAMALLIGAILAPTDAALGLPASGASSTSRAGSTTASRRRSCSCSSHLPRPPAGLREVISRRRWSRSPSPSSSGSPSAGPVDACSRRPTRGT